MADTERRKRDCIEIYSFDEGSNKTGYGCFSRDTSFIEVYEDAALNEVENNLAIYPNPNTGIFYLDGKINGSIEIYNSEGKIVYGNRISNEIGLEIFISSPGIYHLKYINEEFIANKKIIVTN